MNSTSLASASGAAAASICCANVGDIAHNADEDFGACFVGNDIGRAAPGDGADVQSAGAEDGSSGKRDVADALKRIQKLFDSGFAKFGIGRVGHAAAWRRFHDAKRPWSREQVCFRGLAVDDELAAAGVLGGGEGAGAVAFFADNKQQTEIARAFRKESSSAAVIMAAMMPLVSQAPRPQMCSSSSREGMKGGTVSM